MRILPLTLILLVAVSLYGCTRAISRESMALVDRNINFSMLQKDPASHAGRYVILGGIIARIGNGENGSEMEIVQSELNGSDRPGDTTTSQGRFLVMTDRFLDPVIYRVGLPVTVVGMFKGTERRPLLQTQYNYPLVVPREIHLWQPERQRTSPNFHFGIGIGTVL